MKKMRFIRSGLIAVLGIGIIAYSDTALAADKSIKYTKHNLSNWGQYSVKAQSENQVCIFCHAPHNTESAEAPLWNRYDTTQTFTMATTHNVNPLKGAWVSDKPTTISKKCLSCHDGSIAIGEIRSGGPIAMANCGTGKLDDDCSLKNTGPDNPFGPKDLRGGHVISFNYAAFYSQSPTNFNSWASIKDTADGKSMFDRNGDMQCHTCHDPHTDRCNDSNKTIGKDPFWRKACDGSGRNSSVCDVCHTSFADYTAPNLKF